jgi:hypothetical protein
VAGSLIDEKRTAEIEKTLRGMDVAEFDRRLGELVRLYFEGMQASRYDGPDGDELLLADIQRMKLGWATPRGIA